MLLERRRPAHRLPRRRGWWTRVVSLNLVQLAVVLVAGLTWDRWLHGAGLFPGDRLPTWAGALVGYLVLTFVYYWWHRARHASPLLWRLFHQVHHSPARIEVAMSFYKHPLEMLANGLLSSVVVYAVLGLDLPAAAAVTALCALAEFVYHANLSTPRWLGWFIQRPEMHRIHHARDHHRHNYADLPVWDWLFGTYHNPASADGRCGFSPAREARFGAMLALQDVHAREVQR